MTNSNMGLGARMAAIATLADEDILSLSDDEVLAEMRDEGMDPAQEATKLRTAALAKIRLAKRERLVQARGAYEQAISKPGAGRQRPSLDEIKKVVQQVIRGGAANGLQLAFRKGQKLTDSDWEGLWDDMMEMGLIDDAKPKG